MLPEEDMVKKHEVSMLGMTWNLKADSLMIQGTDALSMPPVLTRRKLLQMVAAIYDPLGLWSPSTHYAKVLFQCN